MRPPWRPHERVPDTPAAAEGGADYRLGAMAVSPDNHWLAWTADTAGRRGYRLRIREIASGTTSAALAQNAQPDPAWVSDSRRLLSIQQDSETLLGNRLFMLDREAGTDALTAEGICAPDQLPTTGGSAGGPPMGVVANEQPARYRSISAQLPYVDGLATRLDPGIPPTTNEHDGWAHP